MSPVLKNKGKVTSGTPVNSLYNNKTDGPDHLKQQNVQAVSTEEKATQPENILVTKSSNMQNERKSLPMSTDSTSKLQEENKHLNDKVTSLINENTKLANTSELQLAKIKDLTNQIINLKAILTEANARALVAEEEIEKIKKANKAPQSTPTANGSQVIQQTANVVEDKLSAMYTAIEKLQKQTDELQNDVKIIKSKESYSSVVKKTTPAQVKLQQSKRHLHQHPMLK